MLKLTKFKYAVVIWQNYGNIVALNLQAQAANMQLIYERYDKASHFKSDFICGFIFVFRRTDFLESIINC